MVLPLVQELRRYPLRDQIYKPTASASAEGAAPFQTVEGLSVGVSVAVRYAIDRDRVADIAKRLPDERGTGADRTGGRWRAASFARQAHRARDLHGQARRDPAGHRAGAAGAAGQGRHRRFGRCSSATSICPKSTATGMEGLLAEELATREDAVHAQLKEKQVKERSLEGDAAKVQREKAAEAAASEEIIAAKAREEAMKHVLPLKEKEIEQRRLEAEARKVQRIKDAEGDAEARKIEASAEADSRRKLSDADAYRIEVTGKAQSEQLARDSALDRARTRCSSRRRWPTS